MQVFYGTPDATRSRTQIAFPYAGGSGIAVRSYDSNKSVWSEWNLVYTANTPPPVMNGATSSKAGTAGLAPSPAAGAQGKFLRGDGTWQTPYTHPSYAAKVSGLYKITVDKMGHVSGAEAIHTGRAARFVVGTSTAGWTEADCDYLCDGTSDQTEINAAIAALPSGGGNILLLDGTYNITSPITIEKNNVSLHGCGPATVLARRFNSTSDDGPTGLIDCLCADCTVFNISIDGNKSEYPSLINRGIFARESSVNVTIEEVSISDSRDGIYFGKIKGGCIKGCNIINSVNAIHIYNAIGIDISHNNINTTTSEAVACTGAKLIEISGNHITGSSKNGIRTTDGTTMCNIVNNICLDNAGGISLEDTSMCNVSGNLCMRGSGTPSDYDSTNATIRATSGSANNIISGNLVMGKDVDDSGTGNLVVNNKFE